MALGDLAFAQSGYHLFRQCQYAQGVGHVFAALADFGGHVGLLHLELLDQSAEGWARSTAFMSSLLQVLYDGHLQFFSGALPRSLSKQGLVKGRPIWTRAIYVA